MELNKELEKQIDAYIKGRLEEDETQELWEQLLKYPKYIDYLNTELGVRSIIQEEHQKVEKEENKSLINTLQNSWQWIGAAAAVVVLILAVNFFWFDTNNTLRDLSVTKFNLSENLVSAPVFRSDNRQQLPPQDSLLNLGFKAAMDGKLSEAVRLYDAIIMSHPNTSTAVQAFLNKGIIQFNQAEFKDAIISFKAVTEKAAESSFTKEKGYWFLGNAYINITQLDSARAAIFRAYSMDGIYRKPAIDLLKELDEKLGNPKQEYSL